MLALIVAVAFAGSQDTLAQRKGWEEYQAALDDSIAEVNQACRTRLRGVWAKDTWPSSFDPLTDNTQSACVLGAETLAAICASDVGRQAVQPLQQVTCRYSTEGTFVRLREGTLVFSIDPKKTAIIGKKPGSYSWKSAIEEVL